MTLSTLFRLLILPAFLVMGCAHQSGMTPASEQAPAEVHDIEAGPPDDEAADAPSAAGISTMHVLSFDASELEVVQTRS